MSRTETRVEVRVQRGSLRDLGLAAIIDPSVFDRRFWPEFADLARSALDCFEAIEDLIGLAARRLVDDFTVEAAAHREIPATLLFERAIEVLPVDKLQAGIAPSVLGRAAAEASRRNRKCFTTTAITLRLAAHRAVSELERAVREAEPTAEAAFAAEIADELIELAERIGLADDQPLVALWPRLVARVVEVERPRHRLASRESERA